jgi:hypothetical protein
MKNSNSVKKGVLIGTVLAMSINIAYNMKNSNTIEKINVSYSDINKSIISLKKEMIVLKKENNDILYINKEMLLNNMEVVEENKSIKIKYEELSVMLDSLDGKFMDLNRFTKEEIDAILKRFEKVEKSQIDKEEYLTDITKKNKVILENINKNKKIMEDIKKDKEGHNIVLKEKKKIFTLRDYLLNGKESFIKLK